MKKFKIINVAIISVFALMVSVVFIGCNSKSSEYDMNNLNKYEVKIIDSCEYIYLNNDPWTSDFSITHKGNCKFCSDRNKKHKPQ